MSEPGSSAKPKARPGLSDSPGSRSARPRAWRGWALAGLLIVGVVVGRVVVSGQGALARGRVALAGGDELLAAVELREAIAWALPLVAPWRHEASQELWALAERQRREGRRGAQVQSLSQLRAGWLGGRGFLGPNREWLGRVDAALAPAMAAWEAQAATAEGRDSPGTLEAREAYFAATLARDPMPNRWASLAATLGFALWLFAAWRGAAGTGRWRWLGLAGIGLVAFLAGAWLA